MGFTDVPNKDVGVAFIIDGAGSTITTGEKGYIVAPFSGTITVAELEADQSGSIVVDVWKVAYSSFPPSASNSICASAKPTLSSAQSSRDTTLTGWTVAVAAGDVLAFNVDSVTTVQRVTLTLYMTKNP